MCKKNNTATVTWISWNNYGSLLQAYALQYTLKELGFDNHIISDERIVYPQKYNQVNSPISPLQKIRKSLGFLKRFLLYKSFRNDYYTKLYFDRFRNKNLIIDNEYSSFHELGYKYDVYIAGSDQIWNPNKNIFKPFYYLDFTNKKKISYAPSLGTSDYPNEYKDAVKELLSSFSYISIREKKGEELLSSFIEKDITTVLDPTLLLSKNEWDKIATKTKQNKKYAIGYFLTYNQEYINWTIQDAKRRNIELFFFQINPHVYEYSNNVVAAGPREFISYIKEAEFVYTDSFHATVFSILYEKDFLTFKRFKDGSENDQISRLVNLFQLTDIKDRYIDSDNLLFIPSTQIDKNVFANALHYIETERLNSISFLKKALS